MENTQRILQFTEQKSIRDETTRTRNALEVGKQNIYELCSKELSTCMLNLGINRIMIKIADFCKESGVLLLYPHQKFYWKWILWQGKMDRISPPWAMRDARPRVQNSSSSQLF